MQYKLLLPLIVLLIAGHALGQEGVGLSGRSSGVRLIDGYGLENLSDSLTEEERLEEQRKWHPHALRRDRTPSAGKKGSLPSAIPSSPRKSKNASSISPLSSSQKTFPSYTGPASSSDSVRLAWMSYYASNHLPSWDNASDATADRWGNIYVTGMTDSTLSHTDFITIKYSPSGTILWKRRWTSEFSNIDIPNAMAVDTAGNVYITGQSFSPSSAYDFITLKYNTDGDLLWAKRYDSPEHRSDIATSIAVDSYGNVFVGGGAGGGFGTVGDYDYLTIKYTPDGTEEWVRRYDGASGFLDDGINALAVDLEGSVYVTGFSNSAQSPDVATIKYAPDGTELWVQRYDGPYGGRDEARAISVNQWGNAFVTGLTETAFQTNSVDILTIKYDFSGSEEWKKLYDGPASDFDYADALCADDSGNVYVGGTIDIASTFATIKYNATGSIEWMKTEESTFNGRLRRMKIDLAGNVIVAGGFDGLTSTGTLITKYQPNGERFWSVLSDTIWSNGMAVDPDGNVTIAGTIDETTSGQSAVVRKYSASAGTKQWEHRGQGTGWSVDFVRGMELDRSGNVYLAIDARNERDVPRTMQDLILLKVSPQGDTLWSRRHIDLYTPWEGVLGLDSAGNVYLCGIADRMTSFSTEGNVRTVSYTPDGVLRWSRILSTEGVLYEVRALSVDKDGNVYVGANRREGASSYGAILLKYSSSGVLLRTIDSRAGEYFHLGIFTTDAAGNVLLLDGGKTIKWNPEGQKLWSITPNPSPKSMTVDDSGNVYLIGPGITSKYTSSGSLVWTKPVGDEMSPLAADNDGNLYTASGDPSSIIKYDATGTQVWSMPHPNGGWIYKLRVDDCGNVYAAGIEQHFSPYTADLISLMKISPSGELLWHRILHPLYGKFGYTPFLEVDRFGQVYAGGTVGTGHGRMYVTYAAKLIQVPSLQLSEASVSFGSVPLGCTQSDTISLESSICTSSDGFLLSSSNPDLFTLVPLATPLSPGQASTSHQYVVRFHPQAEGAASGSLTFSHRLSEEFISINVDGTGIVEYPHYSLSSLQYDTTPVGCPRTETLTIQNKRCLPLELQLLVPEELSEAHFDFTIEPDQATIPGQDSLICTVTFMPLGVGTRQAKLILTHNQSALADTLPLSGMGTGTGLEMAITEDLGSTGWHLVSLPAMPSSCSYQLPGSYLYQNGYRREDTLSPGKGYWNKLSRPILSFAGEAVSEIAIPVKRKWNIIGSVSMPIPVSEIQSVPAGVVVSQFFGYTGAGYIVADTIMPGWAYWVKASEEAELILSTSEASAANTASETNSGTEGSRKGQASPEMPLPSIASSSSSFTSSSQQRGLIHIVPIAEVPPPPPARHEDISGGKDATENADETDNNNQTLDQYPTTYSLDQNYPNPFNPVTQIRYGIPEEGFVTLKVFNILGQEVQTLISEFQPRGYYRLTFDGSGLPSGVYLYRIQVGLFTDAKKVLLTK